MPSEDYITKEEFNDKCDEINCKIDDIKDNHLNTILNAVIWIDERTDRKIGNLRWWILGSVTLLGIVIALIQ